MPELEPVGYRPGIQLQGGEQPTPTSDVLEASTFGRLTRNKFLIHGVALAGIAGGLFIASKTFDGDPDQAVAQTTMSQSVGDCVNTIMIDYGVLGTDQNIADLQRACDYFNSHNLEESKEMANSWVVIADNQAQDEAVNPSAGAESEDGAVADASQGVAGIEQTSGEEQDPPTPTISVATHTPAKPTSTEEQPTATSTEVEQPTPTVSIATHTPQKPTVTPTQTEVDQPTPTVSKATHTPAKSTSTLTATTTPTKPEENTPTVVKQTHTPQKPTKTPTNTPTKTPTRTFTPTKTNTATNTPTETFTPTKTNTPTETPTNTPTRTATNTPTETSTPTSTATEIIKKIKTPTNTPTNTNTPKPEDTVTPWRTVTQRVTPVYLPNTGKTETKDSDQTPAPWIIAALAGAGVVALAGYGALRTKIRHTDDDEEEDEFGRKKFKKQKDKKEQNGR